MLASPIRSAYNWNGMQTRLDWQEFGRDPESKACDPEERDS